jgi:VWFA-related protein
MESSSKHCNSSRTLSRGVARSLLATLAVSLSLLVSIRPAQAQQETFGGQVSVHQLSLDVVTQNGRGRPIAGLKQSDFKVFEDGKPVEIVDFRAPTAAAIMTTQAGPKPPTPAPQAAPVAEDRYIVLGFDFQTVDLQTMSRALPDIRQFVDTTAGPGVHWAIVILRPEPYAVTDFTQDPSDVKAGLQTLLNLRRGISQHIWGWGSFQTASWAQQASASPAQFDTANSTTQNTADDGGAATSAGQSGQAPQRMNTNADFANWLASCSAWNAAAAADAAAGTQELVRSLATADGRKSLVMFYTPESAPSRSLSADCVQVAQKVRSFWQQAADAANAAGFTVYASDLAGLEARSLQKFRPDQRGIAVAETTDVNQNALDLGGLSSFRIEDAAKMLAVRTGGRDIRSNRLDDVLSWINTDSEQRYRITVNIPHPHDGKVHQLEVKLSGHPAAQLHYRRAYEDLSTRQMLAKQLAASGNLPKTGGSFSCDLDVETTSSSRLGQSIQGTISAPADRLGFVLQPDGSQKADITALFAVYDPTGKRVHISRTPHELKVPAADADKIAGKPFRQVFRVRLPLGDFTVAGAVYNATDDTACIRSAQVGAPEELNLSGSDQAVGSAASSTSSASAAGRTSTANSHQSASGSKGSPS